MAHWPDGVMEHRQAPRHWTAVCDALKDRWRMKSLAVISTLSFSALGHFARKTSGTWLHCLSSSKSSSPTPQEQSRTALEEPRVSELWREKKILLGAHFVGLRMNCVTARDKAGPLIEVYSYLVSPKDTRWSCGELAGASDETVICNFHLTATEKRCEIVDSAQRRQRRREQPRSLRVRTSLIGIRGIIMGPGPVTLNIFMNSSSSEVWTGKRHRWEQGALSLFLNCPDAARFNAVPGSSPRLLQYKWAGELARISR